MYLGLEEHRFNIYVDKSIHSGWRYEMRHRYDCENCGRNCYLKFQADEPFYCHTCGRLIGVTTKDDQ